MPVEEFADLLISSPGITVERIDPETSTTGVVAEGVSKAACVEMIRPSITTGRLISQFSFLSYLALPNHTGGVSAGLGLLKLTRACPSLARFLADEAEISPAFCRGYEG